MASYRMVKGVEHSGLILAIESAVAGGSISLIRDGHIIAGSSGGGSISRAEDLLLGIDRLLKGSCIEKTELARVAVSIGPGSFTGLRIGISTAMGLSKALGVPCTGVPLFEAIAASTLSTLAIVVPLGRSDLCFRLYEGGISQGGQLVGDMAEFTSFVRYNRPENIAHHPEVDLSHFHVDSIDAGLIDIGHDLAQYVGRFAAVSADTGPLEPIYVRNPRFA